MREPTPTGDPMSLPDPTGAAPQQDDRERIFTAGWCAGFREATVPDIWPEMMNMCAAAYAEFLQGDPPGAAAVPVQGEQKRLLELAKHAAMRQHAWWFDPTENLDAESSDHRQPFDTCQHPDCRLVRVAAVRPAQGETLCVKCGETLTDPYCHDCLDDTYAMGVTWGQSHPDVPLSSPPSREEKQ